MNIVNDKHTKDFAKKPELEKLEKEKKEYLLLGNFLRKKGLALFSYSTKHNKLTTVDVIKTETINCIPTDGELIPEEAEYEKAMVNGSDIHFEALNMKSAERRVERFRQRKIKDLCNLRRSVPSALELY